MNMSGMKKYRKVCYWSWRASGSLCPAWFVLERIGQEGICRTGNNMGNPLVVCWKVQAWKWIKNRLNLKVVKLRCQQRVMEMMNHKQSLKTGFWKIESWRKFIKN